MNTDDEKCLGLAGKLFGHKFEPVFDTESKTMPIDPAVIQSLSAKIQESYGLVDAASDFNPYAEVVRELNVMGESKRTYIHHICPRCGKTVKRNGSSFSGRDG